MRHKFEDIAINSIAKKKPTTSDKYTYLGLEHLDSGNLAVTRFGSDVAPIGEKLIMKKGDILFGKRRAYQKKVAIAPFDGIFSAHGMVLRPKEQVVNKKFFPLFISSDYFLDTAIKISVGSLSPTINWNTLKEVEFELPSLAQQEQISDILWAIIGTKNAYKTLFFLTEQLVSSRFVEMFGDPVTNPMGWEVKHFGNIFTIIDGDRGIHYPKGTDFYEMEYCLFLNAGNVTAVGFDFSRKQFITQQKDEQLRKGRLERGDIVLTTRGTIGNIAIYDDNVLYEVMRINSGMVLLRNYCGSIKPEYFIQLIRGFSVLDKYLSGSAQPQMPISTMKNIPIALPPLPLQTRFADFVRQADKSKFDALKQTKITSLLYNTLTGG